MMSTDPSSAVVLDLPDEAWGHLAVALGLYRKSARANGMRVPAVLRDLEVAGAARAMRGQSGPNLDASRTMRKPFARDPKLLTYAEAADVLTISVRTLKRRISAGVFTPVRDGGIARLRVDDVQAFINNLGATAC